MWRKVWWKKLINIKLIQKKVFYCKYLISAVGSLSAANLPNIKGIKSFKGEWYHSGRWPDKKISFKNQKVAQIGTGSSGIQIAQEMFYIMKKAREVI